MKTNYSLKNPLKSTEAAFNLMELCVVMGCIAVLGLLVLPAVAATKTQSASIGCLYNLRHLMTGWEMYRTENNDTLLPNAPFGKRGWIDASTLGEDWNFSLANTNLFYCTNSLIWPYLNGNLSAFHCPGDVVPSANGMRIRSYSMNGQVGAVQVSQNVNPNFLTYYKGSDIVRPGPASLFVFADESPGSINANYSDGYLQIDSYGGTFPDVPACYLEGGCGFSFADGHGEIHRWQTSALRIPVTYGSVDQNVYAGTNNADWLWLQQHATSHQ